MKNILLLVFPLCIYAGSSDEIMTCKSGTERTSFTLKDSDASASFDGAILNIDQKKIKYDLEGEATIVRDFKRGIYTFKYYHKDIFLTFYAIPNTVKNLSYAKVSKYTFSAIISPSSTDPRTLKRLDKTIIVWCTSVYNWGDI